MLVKHVNPFLSKKVDPITMYHATKERYDRINNRCPFPRTPYQVVKKFQALDDMLESISMIVNPSAR